MSMTCSFPCIKIPTCSSSSCTSSSSPTHSSYYSLRFSSSKPCYAVSTIRNSQTEGPIRRPVAPPVRDPSSSSASGGTVPQPIKPTPPSSQPPQPPQKPPPSAVSDDKNVVTMEFQRQKAKELQEYFKQKKLEEAADQVPVFGFIGKNEISNGRWAMFGFAVGLLTEYATGSDFVDQVKILLSNFGILDLE
ncbi:Light-harvesting complex-like protein ohp2, chloroplastic [Stylosanthes scabra]|uniref:Light-harvesting complex-like protein ohp2, chloroplastic n=1 Tax=Stylosanthes scabra TaxID=79078 RepID=A0ABU6R4T7_9FABA|nr:Light-harvesting complex-like protein ohp2, chloroplastic [Stylosanthes scabra]